jgi:hypothetical protein
MSNQHTQNFICYLFNIFRTIQDKSNTFAYYLNIFVVNQQIQTDNINKDGTSKTN